MTDLTPDEIRNYGSRALRGIASEPEIAALVSMSRRTHDAEQRAERAESLVGELLPYTHSDGRTPADLKIRAREVLATPAEGEAPAQDDSTDGKKEGYLNLARQIIDQRGGDNRKQPEDALAALDQLCKDYDVADDDEYYFIRRHLTTQTPCPHVRTSDGGTSYCTLAEEAIAQTAAELREYQRATIRRDDSVPEWADVWHKSHEGSCWWENPGRRERTPASDLRPDDPGPITLPIVDVD